MTQAPCVIDLLALRNAFEAYPSPALRVNSVAAISVLYFFVNFAGLVRCVMT